MSDGKQPALAKSFTFSFYTMTSIVSSFLPLYFDTVGYSKVQIGMLYAIGPMIGIVSNLLWGYLSDKWGTIRKVMLLLLLGQIAMAPIIFHVHAFAVLYVCMAVFFFFQQPMISVNDSQLLLLSSQSGRSYASFRVFGSIGFAAASFAFGLILKMTGAGGTQYLAYASVLSSLAIMLAMKDVRGGGGRFKPVEFRTIARIVSSPKFVRFLAVILIISFAHRINDGFLALYLRQLHASDAVVGYAWTASALSEIPMFFFLSKYGHKFKELPLLALASVMYFIRYLIMSFITDPAWAVLIQTMHSVTFGIFLFTAIRYVQLAVPDEFRASGQAIFAVTWSSLAGLLSGTIGGYVFDAWGGQWLYRLGSVMAFVAAIGFLAAHWLEEREPKSLAQRKS
jgi:PPP family 3-phenylpropionic acid transporter